MSFVFHFYDHPDLMVDGANQGFIIAYAMHFSVGDRKRELIFPDHYRLVAETKSESLEEIFRLTNSIDYHWSKNRGVCVVTRPDGRELRSTSVGDVVYANKKFYRCGVVGWEEFNPGKSLAEIMTIAEMPPAEVDDYETE